MEKYRKATAALSLMLLLTACGQTMLTQRSIVKALRAEKAGAEWRVELYHESLKEEEPTQKASGSGQTLTAALAQAEEHLGGTPFYGQIQQILLADTLDYFDLRQVMEVLTGPGMVLPDVQVAIIHDIPENGQEERLLETMKEQYRKYQLSANLYELGRRKDCVLLPCMEENEIGCLVFTKEGKQLHWQREKGQLALLLAGQLKGLDIEPERGGMRLQADGAAHYSPSPEGVEVKLLCKNTLLRKVDNTEEPSRKQAEQLLAEGCREIFREAAQEREDIFLLLPWVKNYDGTWGRILENTGVSPEVQISAKILPSR